MPTVPKLNPQVRTSATPGARVSTDAPLEAFGGGQGVAQVTQAASNIASTFGAIAQEEKNRADDVATQDAYAKLVKARNNLMYDPDKGAMAKKGKDAFGVSTTYNADFDKQADEIEKGLFNQEQKDMFRKVRQQQKTEFDGQLQKHTFQEAQQFDQEVTLNGVAATRDDAVLNYQDPGKVQQSIGVQKSLLLSHAQRNGWSPERVEVEIEKAQSQTHSAVISRMLSNGQDLSAKKYFDSVKSSITGQDAAELEKSLEAGAMLGETQRKTTEIISKYGENLSGALQAARQIEDPKLQEQVVREVKGRQGELEAIRKNNEESRFKGAANTVEQTKDRPDPNVWSRLSLQERNSLDARIKQLREGTPPVTDWDKYYEVKTLASLPETQNQFLKTNLQELRPYMADAEFKELVNIQTTLRKGEKSDDLDGYRTNSQIVNGVLLEIGWDPSPKPGSDDAKKVNQFQKLVDDQIAEFQKQTGKKATKADVQGFADTLGTKVVTDKGFFWDTTKRVSELTADDKVSIGAKDVPAGERKKIEAALKSMGIPISDDKVVELYGRKIQKVAPRGN